VIFLDDIGLNLKAAKKMGIHTILVKNTSDTSFTAALDELQGLTDVILRDAKL
jgi:FMN phosphatase YigB (HAD superfamily)